MKPSHALAVLTVAAVLLVARRAAGEVTPKPLAPERRQPPPTWHLEPIPDTPTVPPDKPEWSPALPRTGYGVAFMAGGGVGTYVSSPTRNEAGAVGVWNLRVAYGTRTYAGVEAAYLGGAGSVSGLGGSSQNLLVRNGVEATLRVNAPLVYGRTLAEPYLFAGIGWDHYSVSNASPSASVGGGDDVGTAPVGVGFDLTHRGVVADLRFAFRPTFGENQSPTVKTPDLTNWTLALQLGYEL